MNNFSEEYIEDLAETHDWIDKIKDLLRKYNIRFEAEENIRIHLSDLVIEIMRSGENYMMNINIEIPKSIEASELSRYVNTYKIFLETISKIGIEPTYELDTSIGYVFLRALIVFRDLESLIGKLREILETTVIHEL
ncbi:MAG: hypothetical protein ACP5I7_06980 [Sulfolobales archaeon]